MDEKILEFEKRFDILGARFIDAGGSSCVTDFGFRIVKGKANTYLGTGMRNMARHDKFMLEIANIKTPRGQVPLFELDIVDYEIRNSSTRSIGVVSYDSDKLCFAIRDVATGELHPIFESRIIDTLGNIYDSPELLSMSPEETYRNPGKNAQNLQTKNTPKAADRATSEQNLIRGNGSGNLGMTKPRNTGLVDIYYGVQDTANSTPGWGYILRSGVKSKEDNGIFRKAGNYAYYEVAALAIALSNIKKAQKIRIHSSNDVIPKLLQSGLLYKFSESGFTDKYGKPLKSKPALARLKSELDRLGAPYEVLLMEKRYA